MNHAPCRHDIVLLIVAPTLTPRTFQKYLSEALSHGLTLTVHNHGGRWRQLSFGSSHVNVSQSAEGVNTGTPRNTAYMYSSTARQLKGSRRLIVRWNATVHKAIEPAPIALSGYPSCCAPQRYYTLELITCRVLHQIRLLNLILSLRLPHEYTGARHANALQRLSF